MNIFQHEIKQNLKSVLIWVVALSSIMGLFILIYPSFSASWNESLSKVMENMPEGFTKLLGFDGLNFTIFGSFYAMVLQLITLAGAVQAMNLGTGIFAKEISGKTAEFILTKPVSRRTILVQKLHAVIALLVITNILFFAIAWLLIQINVDNTYAFELFVKTSTMLFLVQLFFASIGFLLGAVLPKIKSVIAVSLPTVFGFYIAGLLDTVIGEDKIRYLTPFKFFDTQVIASTGEYDSNMLIYLAALVIVMIGISFRRFHKRDIYL